MPGPMGTAGAPGCIGWSGDGPRGTGREAGPPADKAPPAGPPGEVTVVVSPAPSAGDDDGLAMTLERQPVAGAGELVGATGDDPVRAEHSLAFQLESHRIAVDVARHRARAVVGHELHARPQPDRDVASCRYVHHLDLTRFAHSGRLRRIPGGVVHPNRRAKVVAGHLFLTVVISCVNAEDRRRRPATDGTRGGSRPGDRGNRAKTGLMDSEN